MSKQLIISLLLGSIVVISLIFEFTNPANIHPLGILLLFACLFILAFVLLVFLLSLLDRVATWLAKKVFMKTRPIMAARRVYLYSSALALAPIILLAIRSIGEGNGYDILLVILLEVIVCFYISKMS